MKIDDTNNKNTVSAPLTEVPFQPIPQEKIRTSNLLDDQRFLHPLSETPTHIPRTPFDKIQMVVDANDVATMWAYDTPNRKWRSVTSGTNTGTGGGGGTGTLGLTIGYDTSTTFTGHSNNFTWSHTTSGDYRCLRVAFFVSDGHPPAFVTYGGQVMAVESTNYNSSSADVLYTYVLYNPLIGTNDIVISMSAYTVYFAGIAISYYNCKQSGQPDSVASNSVVGGGQTVIGPLSTTATINYEGTLLTGFSAGFTTGYNYPNLGTGNLTTDKTLRASTIQTFGSSTIQIIAFEFAAGLAPATYVETSTLNQAADALFTSLIAIKHA